MRDTKKLLETAIDREKVRSICYKSSLVIGQKKQTSKIFSFVRDKITTPASNEISMYATDNKATYIDVIRKNIKGIEFEFKFPSTIIEKSFKDAQSDRSTKKY